PRRAGAPFRAAGAHRAAPPARARGYLSKEGGRESTSALRADRALACRFAPQLTPSWTALNWFLCVAAEGRFATRFDTAVRQPVGSRRISPKLRSCYADASDEAAPYRGHGADGEALHVADAGNGPCGQRRDPEG